VLRGSPAFEFVELTPEILIRGRHDTGTAYGSRSLRASFPARSHNVTAVDDSMVYVRTLSPVAVVDGLSHCGSLGRG
jgi:hypothetical protein